MADILEFCAGRQARAFSAGDIMISEGGQDNRLFVLIEGQVEGWTLV